MLNNTLLYLINELIGWAFSGIYFGNILSYIKFHIIFFFTILYLKKILVGREKGGGGGGAHRVLPPMDAPLGSVF